MHARAVALVLIFALGFVGPAFADEVIDGAFGPGALYRLVRPDNWNGRLLLYAHGYVSPSEPVELPAEADLIVSLLAPQGFAVAFSSFSENGWNIKDGAQRTHQLLGIFASRFGAPAGVYIAGASMGGLITVKLVEQYPGTFVGALPVCAASGGTRLQWDYAAHTRALFDVFYPDVLPGNAAAVPPGTDITTQIVAPALAAMQGDNAAGALLLASIDQTPVPFASAPELVQSVLTAIGANAGLFPALPELRGKPAFDNQAVQYSGGLPAPVLAAINASVERFEAAPSSRNHMEQHYQPSGVLQIPMLMLSTSRDPVVPDIHQIAYRTLTTQAGRSDLLVQRTVNRYGHCDFTPAELGTAFSDLVLWAEYGFKPAP